MVASAVDTNITAAEFALLSARHAYRKCLANGERPDDITKQLAEAIDFWEAVTTDLQARAGMQSVYQRLAATSTTADGVAVELGSATISANSLGGEGRITGKFSGSMTVGTGGGDTVTFTLAIGEAEVEIIITDTDLTIATYAFLVEFELANAVSTALVGGFLRVTLLLADGTPGAIVGAHLPIAEAVDTTEDVVVALSATASDDSDMGINCGYGNISLARAA